MTVKKGRIIQHQLQSTHNSFEEGKLRMSQLSPKLWFLAGQFVDYTIVKRSIVLIRTAPDLHLQIV